MSTKKMNGNKKLETSSVKENTEKEGVGESTVSEDSALPRTNEKYLNILSIVELLCCCASLYMHTAPMAIFCFGLYLVLRLLVLGAFGLRMVLLEKNSKRGQHKNGVCFDNYGGCAVLCVLLQRTEAVYGRRVFCCSCALAPRFLHAK